MHIHKMLNVAQPAKHIEIKIQFYSVIYNPVLTLCHNTGNCLGMVLTKNYVQQDNQETRSRRSVKQRSSPNSNEALSLYHNCDSTTIRLQYDDTMTHLTTTKVIEITICVQFSTVIRLQRKIDVYFLLAWNRIEWKQVRPIRRSQIVVESQL